MRRGRAPTKTFENALSLIHELEVHEIELQIQNEELGVSRLEAEVNLQQWADLFDNAPVGYAVIDSLGVIREVNREASRLLGASRADLAGLRFSLFVHAQHRGAFGSFLGRVLVPEDAPSTETCEVTLSVPGHVDATLSGILLVGAQPRALVAIQDATGRRRWESTSRAHARLVGAVESLDQAVAVFDAQDRLVLGNGAYRRMFPGAPQVCITGRPYGELLDQWTAGAVFADEGTRQKFHLEHAARRREREAIFDITMRDGRRLRVHDRRLEDGGLVETVSDLTETRRQLEELGEMRLSVDAGKTGRAMFLSTLGRELSAPLRAMLVAAQQLEGHEDGEAEEQRLRQVIEGGKHLLRLVDDILDVARVETDGATLEPVRLAEVLDDVRTTLEPFAARQGLHVAIEPVPADVPLVAADRARLTQILTKLGSGAIRQPSGPAAVTFAVSTLQPDRVRITGPVEGSGAGLAVSRRLAQLMGGDVGLEFRPAGRSTFWVDMPRDQARPPPSGKARPSTPPPSSGRARRRLVLHVGESSASMARMGELVRALGDVELLTAPDVEAAVELARERRPDAVVVDISMPGTSGVDALHSLQFDDGDRGIPVIAVTAVPPRRAPNGDTRRRVQSGVYRAPSKTIEVNEVVFALESLFHGSGRG